MRKRAEIENDSKPYDHLALEVLLDIRDLLKPVEVKKPYTGKPRGRPKKKKEE